MVIINFQIIVVIKFFIFILWIISNGMCTNGFSQTLSKQQNLMVKSIIESKTIDDFAYEIRCIYNNLPNPQKDLVKIFTRPIFYEEYKIYGASIIEVLLTKMPSPIPLFKFMHLKKYGVFLASSDQLALRQSLSSFWNLLLKSDLSDDEMASFLQVLFATDASVCAKRIEFQQHLIDYLDQSLVFKLIERDKIKSSFVLIDFNHNNQNNSSNYFFHMQLIGKVIEKMNELIKKITGNGKEFSCGYDHALSIDLCSITLFNFEYRHKLKTEIDFHPLALNKDFLHFHGLGILKYFLLKRIASGLFKNDLTNKEVFRLFHSLKVWKQDLHSFGRESSVHAIENILFGLENMSKSIFLSCLRRNDLQLFMMIMNLLECSSVEKFNSFSRLLHQVVLFSSEYEAQEKVSPFLSFLLSMNFSKHFYFIEMLTTKNRKGLTPYMLAKKLAYEKCASHLAKVSNTFGLKQNLYIIDQQTVDPLLLDFIIAYCRAEWPQAGNLQTNINSPHFEQSIAGQFSRFQKCASFYSRSHSAETSLGNQVAYFRPYLKDLVEIIRKNQPHLLKDVNHLYQLICLDFLVEFSRYQEHEIKKLLVEFIK